MGETPDSRRASSRPIFPSVKSNYRKKLLTLGEFISSIYGACGRQEAKGIVRLAVNADRVAFSKRNLNYLPF
jgi:hypothetical protein